MGLSDLLKPFKELKRNTFDMVDTAIVRHYTKKIMRIEREGGSRYEYIKRPKLSAMAGCFVAYGAGFHLGFGPWYAGIASYCVDSLDTAVMAQERDMGDQAESKTAPSEASFSVDKVLKNARLPLLLSGLGIMGSAFYDIAANPENPDWNLVAYKLGVGYQQFNTAKSIYARSVDPKLLDKVPLWKQAASRIADYFSNPQPVTIPGKKS